MNLTQKEKITKAIETFEELNMDINSFKKMLRKKRAFSQVFINVSNLQAELKSAFADKEELVKAMKMLTELDEHMIVFSRVLRRNGAACVDPLYSKCIDIKLNIGLVYAYIREAYCAK